jgi:transcriptional regulator with XRE-family HTH domain
MCVIRTNVLHIDILCVLLYLAFMTPAQIYPPLGNIVRSRRRQLGLTQHVLAAQLGMSRAALANIETGRQKVFAHQLYAFAAVLNVSPSELLPPLANQPESLAELMPADLKPEHKKQIARFLQNLPSRIDIGNRGE